jgi:hypothetical protein
VDYLDHLERGYKYAAWSSTSYTSQHAKLQSILSGLKTEFVTVDLEDVSKERNVKDFVACLRSHAGICKSYLKFSSIEQQNLL